MTTFKSTPGGMHTTEKTIICTCESILSCIHTGSSQPTASFIIMTSFPSSFHQDKTVITLELVPVEHKTLHPPLGT